MLRVSQLLLVVVYVRFLVVDIDGVESV